MSRRGTRQGRGGFPARSKRPVDKEMIFISHTATTSNTITVLKTTTFPCTIVGLRWDLAMRNILSTANPLVSWIIVVVHDGNTANTISQSNASNMYTPEQDVMAFGNLFLIDNDSGQGPTSVHVQGQTKTMRKLQAGDVLQFISFSDVANAANVRGTVQFFCKT